MKSLVIISIMAVALTGIACSSKKNATPMTTEQSNAGTKIEKSDSLFVSLERSYCFGTCPVYKIEIYNSGFAVYTGQANTDKIGTFTTKFSKDQLNSLTNVAKEINYMSLNDVYDNPGVTDLPSHTSSIVINGVRKTVKRRIGYPQSIVVFEKQIDAIIGETNWTAQQ